MTSYYLWLKAAHVAFMVTWFAGLFYLPRLFIYHAEAEDELSRNRFVLMERRLFVIMTAGAVLTLVLGIALLALNSGLARIGWFQAKVVLLLGLLAYHLSCRRWMNKLAEGYRSTNTANLRWYNEVPVFFLLTIVSLAIVKPF